MKTKLALSVLLLTLFFSFEKGMAQTPDWTWAKGAGGSNSDVSSSIAADAIGNSYVAGWFRSPEITFDNITLTNTDTSGHSDFFVVKYDAMGNVVWAKSFGGGWFDESTCITVDGGGNLYVTGSFSYSVNMGGTILTSAGQDHIFITKLDSSGNVLWAKSAGGTENDMGLSIAVDASGNSYITGYFESFTIAFDSIALPDTNLSQRDIFWAKYDASGNVVWAKGTGGTYNDEGSGIKTDNNGNLYIVGNYGSHLISFGNTTLVNTSFGHSHAFVAKLDASGNSLWAKTSVGASSDDVSNVAVDGNGNAYLAGGFSSFSIWFGNTSLLNGGGFDTYIAKFDSSGQVVWAIKLNCINNDYANNITTDLYGNIYLTGTFQGPDITFGNIVLNNAGGYDAFVAKYDSSGNVIWAKTIGNTDFESGYGIAVGANANAYLTGIFSSANVSFGSTTLNNVNLTSMYPYDIFIARLDSMGTAGIVEQNLNNNLTLYPNPATDYLTIKTKSNKKQVITITDITGKIIYSTTTLADKTIINTKDFPQGVYAVQVQAGDAVQTRKIVVAR